MPTAVIFCRVSNTGKLTSRVTPSSLWHLSSRDRFVPRVGRRVKRLNFITVYFIIGEKVAALVAAAPEHKHGGADSRGGVEVSPSRWCAL